MKTLLNAVETIQAIGNAHPQIMATYYGSTVEIDEDDQNKYPAMHIESEGAQSNKGTMNVNLLVTVFDLPPLNDMRHLETENKALQILQDLIGEFAYGFTYANVSSREYNLEQPVPINPITSRPDLNDRLLGWQASFNIEINYPKTGCSDNIINLPISNSGIGFWQVGTTFIVQ